MLQSDQPNSPAFVYVAANYEEGAWITAVPDTSFNDLLFAPEDLSQYDTMMPADFGITYVIHTTEEHYVKFHFLHIFDFSDPVIEYVYQTDGTRKLFDYISTEGSSWGTIKGMYK